LGHYQQAITCYQRALALHQELGSLYHRAVNLNDLGDVYHATGDQAAARLVWQQAIDILDQLRSILILGPGPGYPDAGLIRAKLRQLDNPSPGPRPGAGRHAPGHCWSMRSTPPAPRPARLASIHRVNRGPSGRVNAKGVL